MNKHTSALVAECRGLNTEGRVAEAVFDLEAAAVEALNSLGLILYEQTGRGLVPLRYFNLACEIDNSNWMLLTNMSHVYCGEERYEEATRVVNKALDLCKGMSHQPYFNAGIIQSLMNNQEASIDLFKKSLSIKEDNMTKFSLACELLATNQWKEGWDQYDYRLTTFPHCIEMANRYTCGTWKGQDMPGKTIFIYNEQGVGDLLQFARYIPEVKKRCGKVYVECQRDVLDILEASAERLGIDKLIPRDGMDWPKAEPDVDAIISICSLPGVFEVDMTKVSGEPYLNKVESPKPEELTNDKFNVGICWAGNAQHKCDHIRSTYLKNFQALQQPGVQLCSLQKDRSSRTWKGETVKLDDGFANMGLVDLAPRLKSFLDCAKIMSHLDLVITVDTAVAHLAGGMGIPTWLLVQYNCDWRWFKKGQSPNWYDSVRLFRQTTRGDWPSLFAEVAEELKKVAAPQG
jgi:tetratricopeptide (TPR) repeat protein